uniref:C-type lectin n=1 Tax=Haemonchus contortus TaxID=6289 RepID=A0A7I4YGC2_HAECO|nr:von Willebrand factor and C-type lectin domain containing protein [Haemonchus contortus]
MQPLCTLLLLLAGSVGVNAQDATVVGNIIDGIFFTNTTTPAAEMASGQIMMEVEPVQGPPIEPLSDECPCNPSNIWLDIFFVIDSSSAMTSSGFDCAMAFVESALYRMTVGQAMGQQSRVGFITYGTDAQMHHNLTYWQSTNDLLNNLDLRYHGSVGTNIEAAIRLATANFDSDNHRPNARKVIVILASAFETGNYNDPTVAAATFKEDGGIIITVEYIQVHGAPVMMLDTLASPGYTLTNRFNKVDVRQLHQLFCKANCFCPIYYKEFTTQNDVPYGGCYRKSTLPAIYSLAQRSCNRHYDGVIATVRTREKMEFLTQLMRSKVPFWTGLKFTNDAYQWNNEGPLQDNDFTQWATNYPDSTQGNCVKMAYSEADQTTQWYSEFCTKDLLYICQIVACSTGHYCPVI